MSFHRVGRQAQVPRYAHRVGCVDGHPDPVVPRRGPVLKVIIDALRCRPHRLDPERSEPDTAGQTEKPPANRDSGGGPRRLPPLMASGDGLVHHAQDLPWSSRASRARSIRALNSRSRIAILHFVPVAFSNGTSRTHFQRLLRAEAAGERAGIELDGDLERFRAACDWGTRTEAGQKVPQAKPECAVARVWSLAVVEGDLGAQGLLEGRRGGRAAIGDGDQQPVAGVEQRLQVDILAGPGPFGPGCRSG